MQQPWQEVVHEDEHGEANTAENEHADPADDAGLLEFLWRRLAGHTNDTGPGTTGNASELGFNPILTVLNFVFKGTLFISLNRHGTTSGFQWHQHGDYNHSDAEHRAFMPLFTPCVIKARVDVGGAVKETRMAQKDPYTLLGVSKNAGDAEIKRAFRKKARQYHPDRNPDDANAESKFKEVQEAYDTIGTAKERNEYEQQQRMSNMFGGGGRSSFGGGGMDDVFKQMFSGGGGPSFGGRGGRQQRQQPRRQQKGADIKVSLDMTLDEAEQGGRFPFTFKRLKPNQSGTMEATSVTLTATIKAGVKHGTVNRLRGQGHDHPEGEAGDVLLTVRIQFGEGRYWDQSTLVQEVQAPYSTLMLGGKVKVKLPSGKSIMLTVAPESQAGDRRKVPGAGYDGGDLELEFVLPEVEGLSKAQIKALEVLRDKGL